MPSVGSSRPFAGPSATASTPSTAGATMPSASPSRPEAAVATTPEGGAARPQPAGTAMPEDRAVGPEAGAARAQVARPRPANAATPEGSMVRAEAAHGPSRSGGGEFVSSMGGASRRIGRAVAVRRNETSGSCKRIRKARRVKESIKEQNTCILITKVKKYTKCHLKQSANVLSIVLAKSTIGVCNSEAHCFSAFGKEWPIPILVASRVRVW